MSHQKPLVLAEAWSKLTSPQKNSIISSEQHQDQNNNDISAVFSISNQVRDINNDYDDNDNDYYENNNRYLYNPSPVRYSEFPVNKASSSHHHHPAGHAQPPPTVIKEADRYRKLERRRRRRMERDVFRKLEKGRNNNNSSSTRRSNNNAATVGDREWTYLEYDDQNDIDDRTSSDSIGSSEREEDRRYADDGVYPYHRYVKDHFPSKQQQPQATSTQPISISPPTKLLKPDLNQEEEKFIQHKGNAFYDASVSRQALFHSEDEYHQQQIRQQQQSLRLYPHHEPPSKYAWDAKDSSFDKDVVGESTTTKAINNEYLLGNNITNNNNPNSSTTTKNKIKRLREQEEKLSKLLAEAAARKQEEEEGVRRATFPDESLMQQQQKASPSRGAAQLSSFQVRHLNNCSHSRQQAMKVLSLLPTTQREMVKCAVVEDLCAICNVRSVKSVEKYVERGVMMTPLCVLIDV